LYVFDWSIFVLLLVVGLLVLVMYVLFGM